MSENDFFVALQSIMERAKDEGRSLGWIEVRTWCALEEFLEQFIEDEGIDA